MASRMDRYKNISNENPQNNRLNKNQELYANIGNNTRYTDFSDVRNSNEFLIDKAKKTSNTREGYQQIREYANITPQPRVKKELDDFNHLYQDHENRIYDINSVLEHARENRKEKDEMEAKRKLKNTNYNILASLNPEELEKYRREKQSKKKTNDGEIRNLIDTITSKTLAGEISKEASIDLLSDLMATNALDMVAGTKENKKTEIVETKEEKKPIDLELSKEILDKDEIQDIKKAKQQMEVEQKTEDDIMKNLDKSFYTKSMDLSDKDFFVGDEEEEKKIPFIIKLLLIIVLAFLIGVAAYYIYQSF